MFMDFEERLALIGEGVDPDDAAVMTALDMVRWELQLLGPVENPDAAVRGLNG